MEELHVKRLKVHHVTHLTPKHDGKHAPISHHFHHEKEHDKD